MNEKGGGELNGVRREAEVVGASVSGVGNALLCSSTCGAAKGNEYRLSSPPPLV